MHQVLAQPTLLPMFSLIFAIAIGVLVVMMVLVGGAHVLGALFHHFGAVALVLLVLFGLGFLFVRIVAPHANNVATMHSGDGHSEIVTPPIPPLPPGYQAMEDRGGNSEYFSTTIPTSGETPVWVAIAKVLLIAVAVIGAMIALVAHKAAVVHPGVLAGGKILSALVALAALGVLAIFFMRVGTSQHAMVKSSYPATPALLRNSGAINLSGQPDAIALAGHRHSEPGAHDATTAEIPIDASAEKPEADATPDNNLAQNDTKDANTPAWVNEPQHWKDPNGQVFVIVVRSGLVTDPNLLEEQLDLKMVARTNQYIDEQLLRRGGAADIVGFDADYLREHCVRQRFPSDGSTAGAKELFAQLEFDRSFRETVMHRYHEFISDERLQQTSGIVAAAFAALGGLYLFLRTTARKQPN
jgi:hypothetical protein